MKRKLIKCSNCGTVENTQAYEVESYLLDCAQEFADGEQWVPVGRYVCPNCGEQQDDE